MSQKGKNKVPGNWRSGAEKKAKSFAEALAIHKDLVAKIKKNDLKDHKSWGNVERYWNAFDEAVQQGKLQLPMLQAYEPVADAHKAKKVVDDAALAKLKAAADAYVAGANDGTKRDAEWFAKFAAEAPEMNKKLAEQGALKAAKAASAAEAKAQNEQLTKLDNHLKAWGAVTKAGEAAVADAEIKDYEAVLAEVVKFKESAPAWYGDQLWFIKGYNAWLTADGKKMAESLGAEFVAEGDTKGKKAKISFSADEGYCYAMVGKWKVASGSEKMDLDWSYSVPTHALGFGLWRTPFRRVEGFCANKKLKATRAGTLTFAGTKNSLHWTVVRWKRDAFPMALAAVMSYHKPDPCSPEHRKQYWTNPVPGGVVYADKQPFMRNSDDDMWLTAQTLNGNDTRIQWKSLSSEAPKARVFGKAFSFKGCWGADSSHDKLAIKLAKCNDGLRKQFGPKFEKANKKKSRAKFVHEVKAANAMLDKLEKQENAAYKAKCQPTKDKIRKIMEKNFNELVDWYADNAPANPLDVRQHIRLQRDARYERPGRR